MYSLREIPETYWRGQECQISHRGSVIPATIVLQGIACQHQNHESGCEVWQGHLNKTEMNKKYIRLLYHILFSKSEKWPFQKFKIGHNL